MRVWPAVVQGIGSSYSVTPRRLAGRHLLFGFVQAPLCLVLKMASELARQSRRLELLLLVTALLRNHFHRLLRQHAELVALALVILTPGVGEGKWLDGGSRWRGRAIAGACQYADERFHEVAEEIVATGLRQHQREHGNSQAAPARCPPPGCIARMSHGLVSFLE